MTLIEAPHIITIPTDAHEADPMAWSLADAYAVEPKRQARILDISRYWRTGGTNWEKVKLQFDGVVICAGIGMREDILLPEHIGYANEHKVPWATYHIPDPLQNMVEQAQWYAERPGGIKEKRMFADWERPYTSSREPTAAEMLAYLVRIKALAKLQPAIYSRWEILKRMGPPVWLSQFKLWIARYLWASGTELQYTRYEPFLAERGWKLPPEMYGTGLEGNVIGWQFTECGDAQYYAANRLTADPVYRYGMTNADLNVSTIPHDEFMAWFWPQGDTPDPVDPPVEPCCICKAWAKVRDIAVNAIENCQCKNNN